MDILFKPRVEATEQMTQNRTFRNPRINESAKSRLSDMYVVFVSCFHTILHLKTEGAYALNLRLPLSFRYRENATKCSSENI